MFTHPFADAIVRPLVDDFYFLPENAVAAPASDLGASLYSKYQQDDEGNKHQEAQDNRNGLQLKHMTQQTHMKTEQRQQKLDIFSFICVHCPACLAKCKL